MNIHVIFTCYNRCKKTCNAIKKIINGNKEYTFSFVVVDDNSSDDTIEELQKLKKTYNHINIIKGNGNLYYSGGMRKGMLFAKEKLGECDYILLINDDVDFVKNAITKLVDFSKKKQDSIVVGATCDDLGNFTYGGIKYKKNSVKCEYIGIDRSNEKCDTFNANCVLIPYKIFKDVEVMDGKYKQAAGDFDYGFSLSRRGYNIYTSDFYVGVCNRNTIKGTWQDTTLSLKQRLKLHESAKGLPLNIWFYYLRKNIGIRHAIVHSITPYIRMILKK